MLRAQFFGKIRPAWIAVRNAGFMLKSESECALTCPCLTVPIAAAILHSPFPLRQWIGVTVRRIQIVRDIARSFVRLSPAHYAPVSISLGRSYAVSVAAAQLPVFKLYHHNVIGCEPLGGAARTLYGHFMEPERPVELMRTTRSSPQSDSIARRHNRGNGGSRNNRGTRGSRRTLACCADKHGQQRHTSEFHGCIVHDLLPHRDRFATGMI